MRPAHSAPEAGSQGAQALRQKAGLEPGAGCPVSQSSGKKLKKPRLCLQLVTRPGPATPAIGTEVGPAVGRGAGRTTLLHRPLRQEFI